MDEIADFLELIHRSPTAYHAAREVAGRLEKAGFKRLQEEKKWGLEAGKGYFTVRDDGMVAAFRLSQKKPTSAVILASHLDSPALKIKPQPEFTNQAIGQLGTEVYGAPLLHTWLDRDLMIAGRIAVEAASGEIQTHLVFLDEYPLIIPGLAIHLDRTIGEKGILVHRQDHLKPIFSLHPKEKRLEELLGKRHSYKQLLGFDLFLVPIEKPKKLGFDKELIAAYRLDNLSSAYASLAALCRSQGRAETLQMAFFWDHEEIGSMTYSGADSLFASQIIERIEMCYSMTREEDLQMKSQSLCLSCDLAHGFHPNFGDKYDPHNAPYLGKGPILKFNAAQKYATSAKTAAPLIFLANKKGIPIQKFASRSDILSGSTVGSIMAANLGIATLDMGIAGWAMHSIRETIAGHDQLQLSQLLQAALEELQGGDK